MDQLFTFIGNHPFLVGTFIILLALFIRNETQRGGQSVSAQQLVDLVNRSDAVVLDVREKKEFEAGHIDGAVNVPVGENAVDSHSAAFSERFAEATGGKPALLYCNSGNRSARAADALTNEHNVGGVRSLIGGITLWNDLGLPVDGVVAADEETEDDDEGGEG